MTGDNDGLVEDDVRRTRAEIMGGRGEKERERLEGIDWNYWMRLLIMLKNYVL